MPIAVFSNDDVLPVLNLPKNIKAVKTFNTELLHMISGLSKMEIERRFMEQNDAWVLWVENIPVAFGWAARLFAPIGELERYVRVPCKQIYLWNFRTAEAWRGKGFYPFLLQQIIQSEMNRGTSKIWIIAKPENRSSYRGMLKAGFTIAGELGFTDKNELVLMPLKRGELADDAADFLELPIVNTNIKPCWYCNSNSMQHAKEKTDCRCNSMETALCNCS